MAEITPQDNRWRNHVEGRLAGLRVNRYSWWVHARELADYLLPRRYKWLITPNQASRGSPINQHILDSTGTLAARNLASGMMSGISSPTRQWFRLKIGHIDSTQTSPTSIWLAECERLLNLVFQESNFYTALATVYFDLVVFGTGVLLIYEDFENVVICFTPCFGEYYIDNDDKFRPKVFYREFVLTVDQTVGKFGFERCSPTVKSLYTDKSGRGGAGLTREVIIAHAVESNEDDKDFGIPKSFKYRECYWECGGSASQQGGASATSGFLKTAGFFEAPHMPVRWDLVSNDAYGRGVGHDLLPDVKQLQQETRRKAQGIDKQVNPPMVADIQLKNQPASLLPGGVTYVAGMTAGKTPGFAPVYQVTPDLKGMLEDLNEVRDRIKKTAFNDLFQTAGQYETRSNVTAVEWDMRKSESMIMLGPVLERVNGELLKQAIDRTFNIAARAKIFPDPPAEIAGREISIEFISMLSQAQNAAATAGIERLFQIVGGLVGVDPAVMDNVDVDYAIDKYSSLMNNDPRIIRAPAQLAAIRQRREQQQQQQQQAEMAEKLAGGAKTLSETNLGGGKNALEAMTGAS